MIYRPKTQGGFSHFWYKNFMMHTCIFINYVIIYSLTVQYPSQNGLFQVGPKNPMKGTSMKSLVSAFYAQFRVDAGG